MAVTTEAQWALYGRAADLAGASVLSCSTGILARDNFSEAIGRFSLGTPGALPQVTLSYLASGAPEGNHVALAIHKFTADRGLRPEETGRLVVSTSYFCVPYLSLARSAVGYLPLYLALQPVTLAAQGGPPLQILLSAAGAPR